MASDGKIRLQLFVDKRIADQLDKMAGSVGWSRNEMAGWLLDMGTSGPELVANRLSAMISGRVLAAMGKKGGHKPKNVDDAEVEGK
jgi:hypothetical protein